MLKWLIETKAQGYTILFNAIFLVLFDWAWTGQFELFIAAQIFGLSLMFSILFIITIRKWFPSEMISLWSIIALMTVCQIIWILYMTNVWFYIQWHFFIHPSIRR